jgi:hypothetical protein
MLSTHEIQNAPPTAMKMMKLRVHWIAALFLGSFWLAASGQVTPEKSNLRPAQEKMTFSINISPLEFRLADVGKTTITVDVTNTSYRTINPEYTQFQLLVNDTLSFIFMLSGNRIQAGEWFSLPPKQHVSENLSSIADGLFPRVGEYKLQLLWKDRVGEEFWVKVLE